MFPTTPTLPTATRPRPLLSCPSKLLRGVLDRFEERRARRLRAEFGRRGWLLSWSRSDGPGRPGPWLARLSCPDLPLTVERRGRWLGRAIRRAEGALTHLLDNPEPERRPE